ncbi:MAG TPA: VWA domain-containing protein [Phycisphaerae bacterium]|nr:VWA domain-containing protein [Phycisphaerae bacterium]
MNKTVTMIASVCIALVFTAGTAMAEDKKVAAEEKKTPKPVVQIAVLLDTSGSMSGLIDQAKAQLWSIVNEFSSASRDGVRPDFQVALYEYGKDSIPSSEGYLRMICPLTDDLDKISQELFALKTNGGSEYCGRVIKAAVEGLKWSKAKNSYKAIFIAGNEPFTQGNVNYVESCKAAITMDIVVNTIHCGGYQTGVDTKWKHGADLADGSYSHIDQNRKAIHIDCPHDAKIAKLGEELNKTYIGYGANGKKRAALQIELDSSAQGSSSGSNSQRQAAKAGRNYRNDNWDLVDGIESKTVKLEDMKDEDLPEEMRKMTLEERKAHVEKLTEQRKVIQEKIKALAAERSKHIIAERKKLADKGEDTLEAVIIKAVRSQAQAREFKFDEKEK